MRRGSNDGAWNTSSGNMRGSARIPAAPAPGPRSYWLATMQQIGLVSALVLSMITDGCGLGRDSANGPAPLVLLPNLPSGCARSDLICVLPLGFAFNRAGKRCRIWDGRHLNAHLRDEDFRLETLQREGRALRDNARYGGTVDVSAAYHHVHMRPDAIPNLGLERQDRFYGFLVLCRSPWPRPRGCLRRSWAAPSILCDR